MVRVSLLSLIASLAACATDPNVEMPQGVFVPTQAVIVDLSYTLEPSMPVYGGDSFSARVLPTEHRGKRREIVFADSIGTRVTAPSYQVAGQLTVERLS